MTPGSAWVFVIGLSALLSCAAGCAGYRLGPTSGAVAREQSIQLRPVENRTIEPRLGEYVGSALRRNLQQEGTFRLSTHGEANVIVSTAITAFHREGVSFDPNDVITVRDYLVTMVAHVTAVESASGRTLLDRDVTGRTTVRFETDLPSAERQAIPLLADDLARNATALLVDGEW